MFGVKLTPKQSREPITRSLRALMTEHGLSLRALAERTRDVDAAGRGVMHSYIAAILTGRETPSPRSLELIAAACGTEPQHFVEYRMWKLRGEIDPREVGFDAALHRFLELVPEPASQ